MIRTLLKSIQARFSLQHKATRDAKSSYEFCDRPRAVFELYETEFALRGIAVDAKFFFFLYRITYTPQLTLCEYSFSHIPLL